MFSNTLKILCRKNPRMIMIDCVSFQHNRKGQRVYFKESVIIISNIKMVHSITKTLNYQIQCILAYFIKARHDLVLGYHLNRVLIVYTRPAFQI